MISPDGVEFCEREWSLAGEPDALVEMGRDGGPEGERVQEAGGRNVLYRHVILDGGIKQLPLSFARRFDGDGTGVRDHRTRGPHA